MPSTSGWLFVVPDKPSRLSALYTAGAAVTVRPRRVGIVSLGGRFRRSCRARLNCSRAASVSYRSAAASDARAVPV